MRRWNDQIKSPIGKYYQFVLMSVIGFGPVNGNSSSELLIEAKNLQEDMQKTKKFVLQPKHPREWLGEGKDGIKLVIPGIRFLGMNTNGNDPILEHVDLRVCLGTICHPNNKRSCGYISFDLNETNNIPIRVFYNPTVAELIGSRYGDSRVEFYMAFSIEHGYHAYEVKLLKKYGCSSANCSTRVEIIASDESCVCPKCSRVIQKDVMNQV